MRAILGHSGDGPGQGQARTCRRGLRSCVLSVLLFLSLYPHHRKPSLDFADSPVRSAPPEPTNSCTTPSPSPAATPSLPNTSPSPPQHPYPPTTPSYLHTISTLSPSNSNTSVSRSGRASCVPSLRANGIRPTPSPVDWDMSLRAPSLLLCARLQLPFPLPLQQPSRSLRG